MVRNLVTRVCLPFSQPGLLLSLFFRDHWFSQNLILLLLLEHEIRLYSWRSFVFFIYCWHDRFYTSNTLHLLGLIVIDFLSEVDGGLGDLFFVGFGQPTHNAFVVLKLSLDGCTFIVGIFSIFDILFLNCINTDAKEKLSEQTRVK